MMKKTIVIFLCFVLVTLNLCSCDPNRFNPEEEWFENVVEIELIYYNNPNQDHFISWVPDHSDDLIAFDNSKVEIIEKLDGERIDDFIAAFISTDILDDYYAYDSPRDTCIRMNYENGDFLIIWSDYNKGSFGGYIGEYSKNGEVLSFWGSFSSVTYYVDLVNDFFEYKIQ